MTSLCETCEHWKFDDVDYLFDDLKFGRCSNIRQLETVISEACDAAGISNRWDEGGEEISRQGVAAAKAIAVDGSGYYAAVRTAPDFGCILHKPRDIAK